MKPNALTGRLGKMTLVLLLAVILALGAAFGGTIAYLMDSTDPVVNTFTYGDINITLTETDTNKDDDDDPNTNQYEMMPGETITKDPKVTVKKGSKDSWLFVKLEKSDNFDTFMTYEMEKGWTQLADADGNAVEGVCYREVSEADAEDADKEFGVIQDNKVKVKAEITKERLNALEDTDPPSYPVLGITAYAVQRDAAQEAIDSAWDAWKLADQAQTGSDGTDTDTP